MRPPRRLSAAAVTVGLALFVVGCSSGPGNVFELSAGDCFDDPSASVEGISDVPLVDCEEPHDNEVFAVFELEGDEFPGDAEVSDRAQAGCLDRFEPYVGISYEDSELFADALFPTDASWNEADDRDVACLLFAEDGPLEGSMEGTQR